MTELAYLSATEALHLFRTRQLSPRELMTAVIERAELVEPVANAFAERLFDQALDAAAEAERLYRPGGHPRPLEGLPVAAKEEQPIAGHPVTDGTPLRAPYVATKTAIALSRIQDAGGIVHARTTTSEFCCLPLSHTRRWGVTRNPWNLAAAAGGSSGVLGRQPRRGDHHPGHRIRHRRVAARAGIVHGGRRVQAAARAQPDPSTGRARREPADRANHGLRGTCQAV